MYRNIKWIEEILLKDGTFSLPGKKELLKSDAEYEIILIDATETPMECPKKTKKYYSGKKKRHTLKTQLVIDRKTLKIIFLSFCNGRKHDFRLFKESGVHVAANTKIETHSGYIGITAIHPNFLLPKKHRKNKPLTKEEKRNNRMICKKRIYAEHAIRFVKRFHILSELYRNRRKRFSLRFSLLAGICNFDMSI